MKKYGHEDPVINSRGVPVDGATVTVYLTGTSTLATLYSDDALTAQANPLTTSSIGEYFFYIEDGVYDITYSGGSPAITSTKTVTGIEIFDYKTKPFYAAHMFQGADAGAKINAALAALPAEGGTVIAGFEGVNNFSTPIVVSKTARLIGLGPNATQFKFTPTSGDAITVTVDMGTGTEASLKRGVLLAGFTLEGTGRDSGDTARGVISTNGQNFQMRDVAVHQFGSDGIVVEGNSASLSTNSNFPTFINVSCRFNGGDGFRLDGLTGTASFGDVNVGNFISTDASANLGYGYYLKDVSGTTFTNAHGANNGPSLNGALDFYFAHARNSYGRIYSEGTAGVANRITFDADSDDNFIIPASNSLSGVFVDNGVNNVFRWSREMVDGNTGLTFNKLDISNAGGTGLNIRGGGISIHVKGRSEENAGIRMESNFAAGTTPVKTLRTDTDDLKIFNDAGTAILNLADDGDLTLYNHLLFNTDNADDIGALGANRPRDVHLGGNVRLTSSGHVRLAVLSPAQLTADVDDYRPGTGQFWRLNSDASRTIHGIGDTSDGRQIIIVNVGSFDIVLANQSVTETNAQRRIITGTGSDLTLAADDTARLIYDSVTTRWRVV